MDSLIKFCEPKYEVSDYIYEFFNTISNIPFIVVAYLNYDKNKKNKYAYISLSSVGFGSLLLHGTGNYYGEMIDEVSMLIFVYTTLCLYEEYVKKQNLMIYNIVFLSMYIVFKIHLIFLVIFGSQVAYLMYVNYHSTKNNYLSRIYSIYSFCIFVTGKILWDLEQNFCDTYPSFKWFHPIWHIFSCTASFLVLKSNEIYLKMNLKKNNSYKIILVE